MGAWIETLLFRWHLPDPESLPAWERGLKRLKPPIWIFHGVVAPCVGAWIETPLLVCIQSPHAVAPCVGAWIETYIEYRPY